MWKLLDGGASINCQDIGGATPLHTAIIQDSKQYKRTDIVKHLLDSGGDPTTVDKNGRLPLHWAVNAGKQSIAYNN